MSTTFKFRKLIGVYILKEDGVVVYVGQTTNLFQRLGRHLSAGKIDATDVEFIPCKVSQLSDLEFQLIQKYRPVHNKWMFQWGFSESESKEIG